MERIISALEELQKINQAYDISVESIERLKQDAACAKVCTPIIGKFSSGKSALVNTVLGYSRKILKEDITPETAIPAEIVYTGAEDSVTIFKNDGAHKSISVNEYRSYEADANTVKCARIQLRNSFLEEIPDVMLVDMPGFESGFEIHNQAIDNYLPQSLAYIVAFPADDMIVRSSVGNILRELCLHDIPLCVVITKYDKKNDDFDETFAKMKESLKRFVGDREIHYCKTSSFTGNAEELEEFLKEIQEKSQDILAHSFMNYVMAIADRTENYLKTILSSSQLSESELDEQEEKLHKQLLDLNSKFSKEQESFDLEISECVEEIKNDVQYALEAEKSTLVAMSMNNQSINEQLNNVVRNAVTVSVKKRFIPKVEKYLKRVANSINAESIGDVHISFNFDGEKLNKGMTSSVVAVAAGILMGLPILGIVAGIIMKLRGDKKREELKQQIRMKLQNEIFPQVLRDVGNGIEMTITKQLKLVNTSIEDEIKIQRDTLEKAMADVRGKINDEKAKKENMAIDIKAELERIGEIRDGLR
jgi:GTPase SAR1 family protein